MTQREIEFTIHGVKYKLREAIGYDDEALITKLTDASGKTNIAELWVSRISKSVMEPPMGVMDVRQLSGSIYNTLKAKWLFLNDPDPAAFLEETEKPSSSTSASK